MQTQDAPVELIFKIWPWLEANKKLLIGTGIGVVAVSGILFFWSSQREQNAIDAGQAVTSALFNPSANGNPTQLVSSLESLAAQYGGTVAGQRAQLHAAGELFGAGNYADAETQFQKYLSINPNGPLSAIALLGVAASRDAQDKADQASTAYQQVISQFPLSPCVSEAQFALGCISERQHKLSEAKGYFDSVVRSTMGGSLAQEASVRSSELQARIAASSPKPTALAQPGSVVPTPAVTQPATKP